MGISVIPQLDRRLRERNLTVAELKRRIEQQLGMPVDIKTLYRLRSSAPVERPQLTVAGAAAKVLGIGLDDLFVIEVTEAEPGERPTQLTRAQSDRMAQLFAWQARGRLTPEEQAELDRLVEAYGQVLAERNLREYAAREGLLLEEARARADRALEEALLHRQGARRRARRAER